METSVKDLTIAESVKEFILKNVRLSDIAEDEDLFDKGIVNSLFSIQLVTFIEKKFNIVVGIEDLDIGNFKSINAVNNFVQSKLATV